MSVRKTVQDSKTEGRLIGYLNNCWNDKAIILLHPPVKDIFELDNENISKRERQYLDSTHFDFVILSRQELKPLLIIEFDGMEGGYSANGEYIVTSQKLTDRYRKLKFDLKIRICEENNLPIVIISWDEIEGYFENDISTILNGIISSALCREEFNNLFKRSEPEFERRISQAQDIIDSFRIDCEVKAENSTSIIIQESNKLRKELWNLGIIEEYAWLDGFGGDQKGNLPGMRCWVKLKEKEEKISEAAYIRGICTLDIDWSSIALEIAELKLWRKIMFMHEMNMI